jgi:hypothetical protein
MRKDIYHSISPHRHQASAWRVDLEGGLLDYINGCCVNDGLFRVAVHYPILDKVVLDRGNKNQLVLAFVVGGIIVSQELVLESLGGIAQNVYYFPDIGPICEGDPESAVGGK